MKYDFAFQSLPFYIDANVEYLKKSILFSCKIKCDFFFPVLRPKRLLSIDLGFTSSLLCQYVIDQYFIKLKEE